MVKAGKTNKSKFKKAKKIKYPNTLINFTTFSLSAIIKLKLNSKFKTRNSII